MSGCFELMTPASAEVGGMSGVCDKTEKTMRSVNTTDKLSIYIKNNSDKSLGILAKYIALRLFTEVFDINFHRIIGIHTIGSS